MLGLLITKTAMQLPGGHSYVQVKWLYNFISCTRCNRIWSLDTQIC